ncbi:MAG TPA: FtsX-like permease family protein [Bacteriovoracaceae bacterium]|nr:FtsX-like permease family protein [Bacteriovoracaceae bacterium]
MSQFFFLIKFGVRNLLRAKGRTLLMFSSLCLSSAFVLWALNFSFSGSREIMNQFLKQFQGHYQITHKDYLNASDVREFDFFKLISSSDFSEVPPHSTPRITGSAFISGMNKSSGVMITGIDPELEKNLNNLSQTIKSGEFLPGKDFHEIIIGRRLAKKLKVSLGEEVALVGQAFDGSFANELFKVVGIFDFGGGDREEKIAFIGLEAARSFYVIPDELYHTRAIFSETPPLVNGAKLKTHHWEELVPEVALSIRFIDNFTKIISFILVIVICLGLSNSLMITFIERNKELRTLNILGTHHFKIIGILGIEVLTLSFFSLLSGLLLGHLATLYFNINPLDIKLFTGGKAIIMGGMQLHPMIRFYPQKEYYLFVPLLIMFFISLSFMVPLKTVLKRNEI